MRWENIPSPDCLFSSKHLCQKLLKSNNACLSYSEKCRGCFFETQCRLTVVGLHHILNRTTTSNFGHNFRKCKLIFIILSLPYSQGNCLCYPLWRLPPHLMYTATLPCEILKFKITVFQKPILLSFHHLSHQCETFAKNISANALQCTNIKNTLQYL